MTVLEPGSVWNTMPSHTHERRMEIYMYFEVPGDNVVFHMMGEPTETRLYLYLGYGRREHGVRRYGYHDAKRDDVSSSERFC